MTIWHSLQLCGCTQHSSNLLRTLRCGEESQTGRGEGKGEKAKYSALCHNLKGKIYVATNNIYSSSETRVFAQILTNICKQHAQIYTNTVFRCHLKPDHQSIMEAARKQCWGARSDRANRKQAAFCIPGQAVQHNTDTPRDTETDHLWPKTIHLPCSPRQDELRWIGFFVLPAIPVICGEWKLLRRRREGEWEEAAELFMSVLYVCFLDTSIR